MKSIITVLYLLISCALLAQDLSNFQLISHYDLTISNEDLLGLNAAIDTSNIKFSRQHGFFSNGIYRYDTIPNGSYLEIDSLPYLKSSDLVFEIEFKPEDMDYRTFMVLGISWRNFTLSFIQDSLLQLTISGRSLTGQTKLESGKWHKLTVIHKRSDSTTLFYIDGSLQGELRQFLDLKPDDTGLTNTHYGSGDVFKGWWKNIKLYRTKTNKISDHSIHLLDVYPNPCQANTVLHLDLKNSDEVLVVPLDGSNTFKLNRQRGLPHKGTYILRRHMGKKIFQTKVITQ